jgi:hypothetical protein
MILTFIVACEIGFWVFIGLGVLTRYVFRARRLGGFFLALSPMVDVALLVAVTIDLVRGGTATSYHALAAVYIGISVMWGHRMVRWADVRAAHRWGSGPAPLKKYGAAYAAECWKGVPRTGGGAVIAYGILWAMRWIVGVPSRTEALAQFTGTLGMIVVLDALWALSYTVWPKKAPKSANYGAKASGPYR